MTLIYIFWGEYSGFKDVLACAKARAGCPIVVVSDQAAPDSVVHFPIHDFDRAERIRKIIQERIGEYFAKCISRWFVLNELMNRNPDWFPVFCSDWDILIFRNLEKAYSPFSNFDYTVSISKLAASEVYQAQQPNLLSDSAHGIINQNPLKAYCDTMETLFSDSSISSYPGGDMSAWNLITQTGQFSVGNLNQIVNGAIFDHNMHCGEEEFIFDGPAKQVHFIDGHPYFTTLAGINIAANTFHCWGTYKTRTEEMRLRAGIPL